MKEYIWVFKTNLASEEDLLIVSDMLNAQTSRWSVDLDDCDRVLRVVTQYSSPEKIITSITNKGYNCSELTD